MASPLPLLPVFPPPPDGEDLSSELQYHLWLRIFYRLRDGESLISADTFLAAMGEEYQALTRQRPNQRIRALLKRIISNVNRKHPETFLTNGVQNAIATAFFKSTEKMSWSASDIEQKGLGTIRRFVSGQMRSVLAYAGIDTNELDLVNCVRSTANKVRQSASPGGTSNPHDNPQPRPADAAAKMVAANSAARMDTLQSGSVPHTRLDLPQSPDIQGALEDGRVTLDELSQRNQQRAETRKALDREEVAKIPQRLDNYAQRGLITMAEADNLRKVHAGNAPLKRNARQFVRERIEQKIRPAMSLTVLNLEVFEALKCIPTARDAALEFLVRHRREILADGDADFSPLLTELKADPDLLANLLAIADHKDQEIAMIALRQSPYGPLFACADRCAVEPGFVQELRSLDRAALSDTLNSPSESTRSDPITQIIGLLQLIDQATRPTAFGQELRILKICGELDDLYHTASLERAAEELAPLLERHLLSSYPGLTHYESDAVQSHIDRLLATDAPGTLKVQIAAPRALKDQVAAPEAAATDPELDPIEIKHGVQIARVSVRVAGRTRCVPYKIMPEKEDSSRYIIVRRDPITGDVVPALKRGRDGFWNLAN